MINNAKGAQGGMSDGFGPFKEFVALTKRKRDLQAELAEVNVGLEQTKEALFIIFEENPGLRMKIDGYTVYQSRRFAAKLVDGVSREEATEILADFVPELVKPSYNSNTFSAWLRGQIEESGGLEDFLEALPGEMKLAFEVRAWHEINARIES